jgi:peptidyl-prolyl isomerase E (cyclophilin E)
METTTVTVSGKGSNPKTVLYVGGLEDDVSEELLKAAFIPFGPIKESNIPLDNETGKHRGFGFVEFEERGDAADAIDNMHNAELCGRCVNRTLLLSAVTCACMSLLPLSLLRQDSPAHSPAMM